MKRRSFIKRVLASSALAGSWPLMAKASEQGGRLISSSEFYELRQYRVGGPEQRERVKGFLRDALIPGMNRANIRPVGVFEETDGDEATPLHVLLRYSSLDEAVRIPNTLGEDAAFLDAAGDYLNLPPDNPPFERIESSLMASFSGLPEIEVPDASSSGGQRIFELRTYESYSELKGWRKVEMFNEGEIDIFRRTGLTPVFFGKNLIGRRLPSLTYMLTFRDREERDENWDEFINHPDWEEMSQDPYYADTVSNIVQTFLNPADFSQI